MQSTKRYWVNTVSRFSSGGWAFDDLTEAVAYATEHLRRCPAATAGSSWKPVAGVLVDYRSARGFVEDRATGLRCSVEQFAALGCVAVHGCEPAPAALPVVVETPIWHCTTDGYLGVERSLEALTLQQRHQMRQIHAEFGSEMPRYSLRRLRHSQESWRRLVDCIGLLSPLADANLRGVHFGSEVHTKHLCARHADSPHPRVDDSLIELDEVDEHFYPPHFFCRFRRCHLTTPVVAKVFPFPARM